MNIIKKIGLFLSSFAPLFILVIFKEIIEIINGNWTLNFLNSTLLISLLLMLLYGIICFYLIKKEINFNSKNNVVIKSKQNITDQHFLGYFSLFVLFAVTFEIEYYSMALIFYVVLTFIGIVYIRNDMYYINPLINLLGYSFYDVEYEKNGEIKSARVFYRGKLQINTKYTIKNKYSNFIFLIRENDL